ncbi:hypothetical protein ACTXG5_27305 [Mycobacterium sp. Dal123C01]|uniref:hypothetical protein n=1 Tax=Mycobacterium sp. Dal123C01 TaxID=3457577 RepID=UPI00403ED412
MNTGDDEELPSVRVLDRHEDGSWWADASRVMVEPFDGVTAFRHGDSAGGAGSGPHASLSMKSAHGAPSAERVGLPVARNARDVTLGGAARGHAQEIHSSSGIMLSRRRLHHGDDLMTEAADGAFAPDERELTTTLNRLETRPPGQDSAGLGPDDHRVIGMVQSGQVVPSGDLARRFVNQDVRVPTHIARSAGHSHAEAGPSGHGRHSMDVDPDSPSRHPSPDTSELSEAPSSAHMSGAEDNLVAKGRTGPAKRALDEPEEQRRKRGRPKKRTKTDSAAADFEQYDKVTTAAQVEALLSELEAESIKPAGQRETPADITRRHLVEEAPRGTFDTAKGWMMQIGWKPGADKYLPKRLSSMEDYPEHRDAIQGLVERLGLHDGQLPEPPKPPITAENLARALEFLVEKSRTEGKRKRGDTVRDDMANEAGIKRTDLQHWITVDGSLRKSMPELARLRGYTEHRDRLRDAFARIGHDNTAEGLPEASGAALAGDMTAETLDDALKKLVEDPNKTLQKISNELGVSAGVLRLYVGMNTEGLRATTQRVVGLSHYAERRDSIVASLEAMGLHNQAEKLPPTAITAMDFLRAFRHNRAQFGDAFRRMQNNPTLSARDAAEAAGAPWEAFSMAVGAGGTIRSQKRVESELLDLPTHLQEGLDDAFGQLNRLAEGAEIDAISGTGMIGVTVPGAAYAPERLFIIDAETNPAAGGRGGHVTRLYEQNPELVHDPRSYEHDRATQLLRWMSTVLKEKFSDSTEVQSYFDAEEETIYVSSNNAVVNDRIRELLNTSGLEDLLESREGGDADGRQTRHWSKLKKTLSRTEAVNGTGVFGKMLTAIEQKRFRVPNRRFFDKQSPVHLHAERRIHAALKEDGRDTIDLELLAGTMRACGYCAADLGFDDQRPRGPFWKTNTASHLLDGERIIEENVRKSIGSYVTRTRSGKITTDYNTDSDSDADTDDEPDPKKDG